MPGRRPATDFSGPISPRTYQAPTLLSPDPSALEPARGIPTHGCPGDTSGGGAGGRTHLISDDDCSGVVVDGLVDGLDVDGLDVDPIMPRSRTA